MFYFFYKLKKYDFKNFPLKMIFVFIYIFSINYVLSEEYIILDKDLFIDIEKCHWIPNNSRRNRNQVKRICIGKNKNIFEVTFDLELRKALNSKLLGNLDKPLVFKDKKNMINKNKDNLIYTKIINGNLFKYSCQRSFCNSYRNDYKKIGIRRYFWD